MMIKIPRGDTYAAKVTVTGTVPEGAEIVFSIAKNDKDDVILRKAVVNNILSLTHAETQALDVGKYVYDFRVYLDSLEYVKTPIVKDTLEIIEVINDDIRPNTP